MKQTICYLYEYENNKQSRNVGFIKCIFQQQKITFQIHGKGIECNQSMGLEMFLFTQESKDIKKKKCGIVEGIRGTVNYKMVVEDMTMEKWSEYDGILLVSSSNKRYIATWKRKEIKLDEQIDVFEQDCGCDDALESVSENFHEELDVQHMECGCQVLQEEASECDCQVLQEEASECGCEMLEEESKCCCDYIEGQEPECGCETIEVADTRECSEQITDEEICGCDNDNSVQFTYEKIHRQDISRLQQREWKLANNNFLIHGYSNYKHLVFIRQDERLYLGVPGVYYKKEAEIANSFGFSNFHEVLDQDFIMSLDDREYSPEEGFGYWCRPVTERYMR